jgi:hypothetical protein
LSRGWRRRRKGIFVLDRFRLWQATATIFHATRFVLFANIVIVIDFLQNTNTDSSSAKTTCPLETGMEKCHRRVLGIL